jgi:hypothetical protein
MRNLTTILLFLSFLLSQTSCLEKVDYPDEPVIEFIGFYQADWVNPADSVGVIKISFTDGNGDLGLDPADTFGIKAVDSAYYYNLFIDHYEMQNGEFVLTTPATPNHVRFPTLSDNEGDPLEGDMDIGVFADPTNSFDTVKWEVYIVDRAYNRSNVISTEEVILDK